MRDLLDRAGKDYPEYLPAIDPATARSWSPIGTALEEAHYPASFEGRDAALRRLAFDELLALQLGMVGRRRQRGRDAARPIPVDDADGRRPARDADRIDLAQARPGRRADDRPGDGRSRPSATTSPARRRCSVSSRATSARARRRWRRTRLAAAARVGPPGRPARPDRPPCPTAPRDARLAPRGRGDPRRAADRFDDRGRRRATRSTCSRAAWLRSSSGRIRSSRSVSRSRRSASSSSTSSTVSASSSGASSRPRPAATRRTSCSMTATPIPRTLGQVLYADLDVSDLRTPPEGRIPIRTGIRHPDSIGPVWDRVRAEAAAGHRTFVVVP